MPTVRMAWGLSAERLPIHIRDAENGRECNATCIECGGPLVANQGGVKKWYFSHYAGTTCSGESIIHFLAKHFIATISRPFSLPSINVNASLMDMTGHLHERVGRMYGTQVSLIGVEQEVSAAQDLRPDCRAVIDGIDETIWIEIFYSNQKNEVDQEKIRRYDLNCLEVDVSGLMVNSTFDEIIEAVFDKAPRRWLHHSAVVIQQDVLGRELETHVEVVNQGVLESLSLRRYRVVNGPSDFFRWPDISEKCGAVVCRETPTLKSISSEWQAGEGYWRTSGETEKNKVTCDVVFCLALNEAVNRPPFDFSQLERPTLLIEARLRYGIDNPHAYFLSWHNIGRWEEVLVSRAKEQSINMAMVAVAEQQRFLRLPPFPKVAAALSLVGLSEKDGLKVGALSAAWSCYPLAWKCLILKHFMLVDEIPVTLKVDILASHSKLRGFLGFPMDEGFQKKRAIELYFWLANLEKEGYLVHEGRQRYRLPAKPKDLKRILMA